MGFFRNRERREIKRKAIPQAATNEIGRDCVVRRIYAINNSGGTLTVQANDADGSPILPVQTLPNNSRLDFTPEEGETAKGGVVWSASGPGLYGGIVYFDP